MLLHWEMQPDPDKSKRESFCESSAFKMRERFTKTLYYGEMPEDDCPSLPLTDVAVEYFQDVTPRKLGRVDQIFASSVASRACVSPCSVVMSMIYAKRLRHRNPEYLDRMSSSDLFLISMMMASKFIYDEGVEEEVFNDEWAEAADMELTEINQLEQEFLQAIDWQLFVKRDEFFNVVNQIEQRVALQQALDRGWFSYTDLCVLMRNPHFDNPWSKIGSAWLQVVFIGSTAYMAGFLTLVGSTLIAFQVSTALTLAGTAMLATNHQPMVGPMPPIPFDIIQNESTNLGHIEMQLEDVTLTAVHIEEPARTVPSTQFENNSQMDQVNLVESLVHKLFALMTLKENLIKFVCAVFENFSSALHNQSLRRRHQGLNKINQSGHTNLGNVFCYNCGIYKSNSRPDQPDTEKLNSNQRNCLICPNCLLEQSTSKSSPLSCDLKCLSDCHYVASDQPSTNEESATSAIDRGRTPTCHRQQAYCCEEPPGLEPPLLDTRFSFTTRAQVPISLGA